MSQRPFHRLKVAEVITETDDACSLVFAVPPELAGEFAYRPGQFLTLRVPGEPDVARCYSLSSSPAPSTTGPSAGERDRHTVTVKRAGYASGWIADNVRPGTELDVLPPAGVFTPANLDADLLLFAGGSGITPVMSILKSVLRQGQGRIVLIYTNRDERSVIFAEGLRQLAADNPGRLLVIHWLDSVQGYPTAAAMTELARPYADYETFLCGPEPYMKVVRESLKQLGVPKKQIHVEKFQSLSENPFEERPREPARDTGADGTEGPAATLEVNLDGEQKVLTWPAGARMLDVMVDEGLDAPFSCREGSCGACACQVTAGEVKMANNEVLEEEDLAEGYVLACQSVAVTGKVSITY